VTGAEGPLIDEFVIVDNGSTRRRAACGAGGARVRVVLLSGHGNIALPCANLGAHGDGDVLVFLNPDAFCSRAASPSWCARSRPAGALHRRRGA